MSPGVPFEPLHKYEFLVFKTPEAVGGGMGTREASHGIL